METQLPCPGEDLASLCMGTVDFDNPSTLEPVSESEFPLCIFAILGKGESKEKRKEISKKFTKERLKAMYQEHLEDAQFNKNLRNRLMTYGSSKDEVTMNLRKHALGCQNCRREYQTVVENDTHYGKIIAKDVKAILGEL